ncbi:MAG TPA: phosphoserine transaminase [Acidimicrobiales bacterium]
MSGTPPAISIPDDLKPADGRFGSGPSKVRPEAVDALAATGTGYLGTSHRQATVQFVVGSLRNLLAEILALPDGYEVLLGNGGTTAFWDAAIFGLIDERSQHLSFGEFSSKFAAGVAAAPHLCQPSIIVSDPGTHPLPVAEDDVDAYCLTQNETSTGVAMPLSRPADDGLVLVDATSAACGIRVDLSVTDVYYFAPQKALAADGGLWIAVASPAAIERIEALAASDRWVPASLDLKIALDNSRKDQTYNTPALATIFLAEAQARWVADNGGLEFAAGRSEASAKVLYDWAEDRDFAAPYVTDPAMRSPVVGTIDFEGVDANTISAVLRANGIVDTDSYRKLGRNQLRIAMFPAIDPSDIDALTACIDHVVEHL